MVGVVLALVVGAALSFGLTAVQFILFLVAAGVAGVIWTALDRLPMGASFAWGLAYGAAAQLGFAVGLGLRSLRPPRR